MTTSEIDRLSTVRPLPTTITQATAVEQARAVAEVAAAVKVAQEFPRDTTKALGQMREACQQRAMADRAFYSLPRAGGRVEGSTVHLARELARCWGNVDYGIREMRRDDTAGESEMQAWAWDQEANVRSARSFIVPHAIMAGKGADKKRKPLTDLGDIANNNNSVAARAVRETIFTILPVWFRTEAEDIAMRTLQGGDQGKTLAQQTSEAVAHFEATFNVRQEQIEKRLGRPAKDWTAQDLGFLRVMAGELARGEKRVNEEFPTDTPAPKSAAADVLAQTQTQGEPVLDDPTTDPSWGGDDA